MNKEQERCCIGGSAPKPPGFSRFFPARMAGFFGCSLRAAFGCRPLPFRPLSRSLELLPSRALSRPTQVITV